MKYTKYILLALVASIIFTGCGVSTSNITKGEFYPKVYKTHPKSILVLPAVNSTTSVDATNNFRYTITQPLAEQGYYVFPVHLVDAFFKSEHLVDASLIRKVPVSKLREVFNPDAILYVDINAWDTGYKLITSNVDVGLSFSLVDAKTGNEIWQNDAYAYSFKGISGNGGIVGLLVDAISVAINTSTDYVELSRVANQAGIWMLPEGPYSKFYKKDFDKKIVLGDYATLDGDRIYVNPYFIFGNKKKGKIALTVRGHADGYHGFSINNMNYFDHNGYANYYITTHSIKNQKFLRNRFFKYENNRPYLLSKGQKVFVFFEKNGTIPYSEENGKYYFQVIKTVQLKNTKSE